jgi:hypothetical protein
MISFPGTWYAIADYSDTPASNPPTFSLIDGNTTAGGVALTYNNDAYQGTMATVMFKFICAVSVGVAPL